MTLQELLDALARGDDLAALLAEVELDALEAEALSTVDSLLESESLNDEDVASMDAIATVVEAVRTEGTRRATVETERQQRVADIRSRVARPEAVAEESPAVEAPPIVEQPEAPPVAVAAARVNVADIARRTARPTPPPPAEPEGVQFSDVFLPASDVQGVGAGFTDWKQFCQAFQSRAGGQPQTKTPVARIRKFGFTKETTVPDMEGVSANPYFDAAAAPENLTASGWCSPSETWYDLCPSKISTANLYSIPEINAPRGGVRYSRGADLCTLYGSAVGFAYTETELLADPTKPCIMVPCPTFEPEVRLGVEGICVQTDIPMDSSYPEAVQDFMTKLMALHARKVSGDRLAKVLAGSIDLGVIGTTATGSVATFFSTVELMAINYRNAHLDDWDAQVEITLPSWVRGNLRSDWIKRNGTGDNAIMLADAAISSGLAQRNVTAKWVNTLLPGENFGSSIFLDPCTIGTVAAPGVPVENWPEAVEVVMAYPGTWVAATKDVINVSTIYDAANLQKNKVTSVFMENGVAVLNRCNHSVKFTIPLCPSGTTGGQNTLACLLP